MFWLNATDCYGIKVPGRLKPIFAGRAFLTNWLEQMEFLRTSLGFETEFCAEWFDAEAVRAQMMVAEELVRRQLPFAQCVCHSHDDCEKCGNKRWLTVTEHQMAFGSRPVLPLSDSSSDGAPSKSQILTADLFAA